MTLPVWWKWAGWLSEALQTMEQIRDMQDAAKYVIQCSRWHGKTWYYRLLERKPDKEADR